MVWATALLLSPGCSSQEQSVPMRSGQAVLYSLLGMSDAMFVRQAPEEHAPEQRHMRPSRGPHEDAAPLPCFMVRPPTQLGFRLEDPPGGARLQYSLAVRNNGYRGRGHVRVTATLAGEPLFEHVLDCSADLPESERLWRHQEALLTGGGELSFTVQYQGDQVRGPWVGLGLLRVVVPYSVPVQLSSPEQPNVVLVVIDTLRASGLGCMGSGVQSSPVMDRLAREGALFSRAYSSAPWTIPGTASVLTGLSPPEHGLGDADSNYLADRLPTLPKVFARAGFATAGISCNPLVDRSRNFAQGFQFFRSHGWVSSTTIREELLGWLSQVGDQRFFLYFHPTDPHAPYAPPRECLSALGIDVPEDLYEEKLKFVLDRWYAGGQVDLDRLQRTNVHNRDLYAAEVLGIDRILADLVQALEEYGLSERTLICVTSDHGEEFLEHGLVGHFNQLYPESVHVPLLFWGPGVSAARVVHQPVENRLVAPTLVRAAGLVPPPSMDGPSLLNDEDLAGLRGAAVFLTSQSGRAVDLPGRGSVKLGHMHGLIEAGWQLIDCPETEPPGQGFSMLFDLAADPGCLTDVSAQHPERVRSMRGRIEDWLAAGRATRPELMPTTQETRDLLRSIGYVGDDQ